MEEWDNIKGFLSNWFSGLIAGLDEISDENCEIIFANTGRACALAHAKEEREGGEKGATASDGRRRTCRSPAVVQCRCD